MVKFYLYNSCFFHRVSKCFFFSFRILLFVSFYFGFLLRVKKKLFCFLASGKCSFAFSCSSIFNHFFICSMFFFYKIYFIISIITISDITINSSAGWLIALISPDLWIPLCNVCVINSVIFYMIYFKYFDQEGYVVRQDLFLEISCTDKLLMREIGAVHILDIYT